MDQRNLAKYGGLAAAGLLIFSHIRKNPNKLGGLLPSSDSRNQVIDQWAKRHKINPMMSEMTKNVLNEFINEKMGYREIIDVTPRDVRKES